MILHDKGRNARSGCQRGSIAELPGGALRVCVYAGVDAVTKRRLDLVEVIPPGPRAEQKADGGYSHGSGTSAFSGSGISDTVSAPPSSRTALMTKCRSSSE